MDDIAIKVDNVSKTFKLPYEKSSTIKGAIINFRRKKKGYKKQTALKNISFEVKKGEFFGIVGRNGSGKSTLLKLISGIYAPDSGAIHVNGKLTPFIELGVGFNPELSGKDNVYLNGALLGFNRKEMESMYDEIVAFAELEKFMEQKLKNYSSGMQVRLAFSIAIRANSDILVLDEVLAVGDEAFQRKCHDYFEKLKQNKKTVILVTHSMGDVERFCNRAILIDEGKTISKGKAHKITTLYSELNDESYDKSVNVTEETTKNSQKTNKESHINIKITKEDGSTLKSFTSGDRMQVKLSWQHIGVKNVGVAIFKQSGEYIYGTNTIIDKVKLNNKNSIDYVVSLTLAEGRYFIKAGLFGQTDSEQIDFEEQGTTFTVHRNKEQGRWGGIVNLKSKWYPQGPNTKLTKMKD